MSHELEIGLQHGCCVDFENKGLLILGASGSGKSTLALACIGLGAVLVGDDYVELAIDGQDIIAKSPPNINGLIEVAGVGVLNCDYIKQTKLRLVIDLSIEEAARLPQTRHVKLQNREIPLIYGRNIPYLHNVAMQYLKAGRADV